MSTMKAANRATLGIALGTALLLAGCGSSSHSTARANTGNSGSSLPSVVDVGILESLTGPYASFCAEEANGAKLAINDANTTGLLGSAQIKAVVEDDQSSADKAVTGYRDLVDRKVAGFTGPCIGVDASVLTRQLDQNKVPEVLGDVSTPDLVDPQYAFRASVGQDSFATQTIEVASKLGIKSMGILYSNAQAEIVTLLQSDWEPYMQAHGIKYTAIQLPSKVTDISAQIAQLKETSPQGLGNLASGADSVTVTDALRSAGMTQPIFGQASMAFPFYESAGPAVNNSYYSVPFDSALTDATTVSFTNKYKAAYNAAPSYIAAAGYDAMGRLLQAIKAARSADPVKVQAALATQKTYDGVEGHMTVTANGDVTGAGQTLGILNGKVVMVTP